MVILDNKVPCYKCETRSVGCHSTCSSYGEYHKAREKLRKKEKKRKSREWDFVGYKVATVKRVSGKPWL